MSVRFASKLVYVGNDEFDTIDLDNNARIVGQAAMPGSAPAPAPSLSHIPASVPRDAFSIVTSGDLGASSFNESYMSTIGCAFKVATAINLGRGESAKAQLWDTAGQERYRTIGRAYYRGTAIAVVVYDIADCSIANIRHWVKELRDSNSNAVVVLFGNKSDLKARRTVAREAVDELAAELGIFHAEVSAKTTEGLAEAFARMYSESYMDHWSRGATFGLVKAIIVGDSGVGKTSLFERLSMFSINLEPLARRYPIAAGVRESVALDAAGPAPAADGEVKRKRVRKADTNVIAVNLAHVVGEAQLLTGDPLLCTHCGAAFSSFSKVEKKSEDEEAWRCEFCATENEVMLAPEEYPQNPDMDYLLEASPAAVEGAEDNAVVVFCIDTSGSMAVASPMKGRSAAENKSLLDMKRKKLTAMGLEDYVAEHHVPPSERDTVYVSRLEAVQAAVEAQFIDLQQQHPNRRVLLVAFNTEVVVYGDGSGEPLTLAGDMLDSAAALRAAIEAKVDPKGKRAAGADVTRPIVASRVALSEKLFGMHEDGQTALGPALLVSLALAGKAPGSRVALCTDGLANVGIGRMDSGQTAEDIAAFYNDMASAAIAQNTSVSLMSFRGSDCNIEALGAMATRTGGQVEIVEPAEVQRNFRAIFADDTVATHVTVTAFFPRGLALRREGSEVEWADFLPDGEPGRFVRRELGSINADSNLLVQYSVDPSAIVGGAAVPFQLQVAYTRPEDGARLVRIVSRRNETTSDRSRAEAAADAEALALDAVRRTAAVAQAGDYTKARLQNLENAKLLSRIAEAQGVEAQDVFRNYMVHNTHLESTVLAAQREELRSGRDWDDAVTEAVPVEKKGIGKFFSKVSSIFSKAPAATAASQPMPAPTSALDEARVADLRRERFARRGDDMAKVLWGMKGQNML